jgi:pimeloyl-ACP methyl ester carboxylesterase
MRQKPRKVHHKGCELAYSIEGDCPPAILIQGVGINGSGWQTQTAMLSSEYTCLTFDNRGIRQSQPAPESLTVVQMADDVGALMDHQDWSSAHIA